MGKKRFRSIWISDVHLGIKNCQAGFLLDFLQSVECDLLYLVGDLIDFEEMYKGGYWWPTAHTEVLQAILTNAVRGTRVVYIPGNHDEVVHDHTDLFSGKVEIRPEAVHETADGRRFLVTHGDIFDGSIKCNRLLNRIGGQAYCFLLFANRGVNATRRQLGFPYWSLADFFKSRIGNIAGYIARFEVAAAYEAARRGLDGVICGHIHKAALSEIEGVLYCNDGDWVENCTALVEHEDGRLEIIRWTDQAVVLLQEAPRAGYGLRPDWSGMQ